MCVKNAKPLTKWCSQLPQEAFIFQREKTARTSLPPVDLTTTATKKKNKPTANVVTAHAIANRSKIKKGKATGWITKYLREKVLSFRYASKLCVWHFRLLKSAIVTRWLTFCIK